MNKILQNNIYTALKNALSGTTVDIYFLYLPNEDLLKKVTCIYEINNTDNLNTFESKEALKTYTLRIKINASTSKDFSNYSDRIKTKIYALGNMVTLVDEEIFYDSELDIYTEYIQFEIK